MSRFCRLRSNRRKAVRMQSSLHSFHSKCSNQGERAKNSLWPEALSSWHTVHANPMTRFRHKAIGVGHFTKPTGRRYPTRMCHWPQFYRLHGKCLCTTLQKRESSALYSREHFERYAKDFISGCQLNNEAALVAYEKTAVEKIWWSIHGGKWERAKYPHVH